MDGWKDNASIMSEFMWLVNKTRQKVVPHYFIVNTFSATTCTMPNPRFRATLSDSESTILSPTRVDNAHGGKASLLTQSDAILSARTLDLDARRTCAAVAHLGGANDDPCQLDLDHIGDCDCDRGRIFFSPDFAGCCCVAEWLVEVVVEGNDGSWGKVGDNEGGDEVIGPRSAGINDEVAAASDARPVLGERASDMLDFGGMGLNFPRCNAASTFSQVGRAAGETFKRLSRSTRYERGNLRDVNNVSRRAVLLNPVYDDTSRSNRSVSLPPSSSSLRDSASVP